MKKRIPKSGYRVLAVIWTLAAASMAVAFIRYLPVEFNLFLLMMAALSTLIAANFWRTYRLVPEEAGADPLSAPPKFADNPELFDDIPPVGSQLFEDDGPARTPNKDSEENDNER